MLEALGTPSADYQMLLAMMTELAHTGTLVIDDIEDRAQVRRGAEAIHLRYGIEVAINATNTVYFLPLLVLSNYPHLSDYLQARGVEPRSEPRCRCLTSGNSHRPREERRGSAPAE